MIKTENAVETRDVIETTKIVIMIVTMIAIGNVMTEIETEIEIEGGTVIEKKKIEIEKGTVIVKENENEADVIVMTVTVIAEIVLEGIVVIVIMIVVTVEIVRSDHEVGKERVKIAPETEAENLHEMLPKALLRNLILLPCLN